MNPWLEGTPQGRLVVAPEYMAPVGRYAAVAASGGMVTVDTCRRYNHRDKSVNRAVIAGCNGLQRLTVPLCRCAPGTPLDEVMVSDHNRWWAEHWTAIASAYGRTPYFEFYADELSSIYDGTLGRLVDLDRRIDLFCRRALLLPEADASPELPALPAPEVHDVEYWQIWRGRAGAFTPGLPALDLIFNMGPEAPLVLRAMSGPR